MAKALAMDAMPTANPVKGPKKVTFGGKAVEMAAAAFDGAQLGTPRGRYEEYSS
jgi:hypothetical protein